MTISPISPRRQGAIGGVHDAHFDPGARKSARGEPLEEARMALVRMPGLRQAGDRHRALALAEELVEARSEQLDRAHGVGHVHGRAAIDDRLQVGTLAGRRTGQQSHDHGGRGEKGSVTVRIDQAEEFRRVESAALRDHVQSAGCEVGQGVQP